MNYTTLDFIDLVHSPDNNDLICFLLDNYYDFYICSIDHFGNNILHNICIYNNIDLLFRLPNYSLLQLLFNNNYASYENPLFTSLRFNRTPIFKHFLQFSFDINATNAYGSTLLHIISINNNIDALNLILPLSPDFNIKDANNHTPIYYSLFFPSDDNLLFVKLLVEYGSVIDLDLIHLLNNSDTNVALYLFDTFLKRNYGWIPEYHHSFSLNHRTLIETFLFLYNYPPISILPLELLFILFDWLTI